MTVVSREVALALYWLDQVARHYLWLFYEQLWVEDMYGPELE